MLHVFYLLPPATAATLPFLLHNRLSFCYFQSHISNCKYLHVQFPSSRGRLHQIFTCCLMVSPFINFLFVISKPQIKFKSYFDFVMLVNYTPNSVLNQWTQFPWFHLAYHKIKWNSICVKIWCCIICPCIRILRSAERILDAVGKVCSGGDSVVFFLTQTGRQAAPHNSQLTHTLRQLVCQSQETV